MCYVAFFIFVLFCMKFVWPPVITALQERQKKIADGLAAAEKGQQELVNAQGRIDDLLKTAKQQSQELVANAQKRADEMVEAAKESAKVEGERQLAVGLRAAGNAEVVLVDTPPSLGLVTVSALAIADAVLVPVQCEYYALEGLSQLMATIRLVRERLNPALQVNGFLLTMLDPRTKLGSDVVREVEGHFGDLVYRARIPRSVRLAEAPSHGIAIRTYAPGTAGAESYARAAEEFAERVFTAPSSAVQA